VVPGNAGDRCRGTAVAGGGDADVEVPVGEPAGLVAEMGGPRVYTMGELVRVYLRATNKHRLVLSVPAMGGAAAAIRAGANLTPDHAVGQTTWEDYVSEQVRRG